MEFMELFFLAKLDVHEILNLLPCVDNKPPSDFVKLHYSKISLIRT